MTFFAKSPNASRSLRALARLLIYPDADLRSNLEALRNALHSERALTQARLVELDVLIDSLQRAASLDVEANYVELFDRGRATSLYLFEHVHGDSRERGPAMIDLAQTYEQAGLFLAEREFPDFLPVVLEFTSTQPPREARAFLAEVAHILNAILAALQQRRTPYAAVLGALLELAGEVAQPIQVSPDEAIDTIWEEPLAFDGCSAKGQARPDQPQPVRIVRQDRPVARVRT